MSRTRGEGKPRREARATVASYDGTESRAVHDILMRHASRRSEMDERGVIRWVSKHCIIDSKTAYSKVEFPTIQAARAAVLDFSIRLGEYRRAYLCSLSGTDGSRHYHLTKKPGDPL